MRERAEELKQRIRETPLDERLDNAKRRIGRMCSEGRPPRMTIPVQYDDDDFYISTTLSDAQATIADLQGQVKEAQERLSLCEHELGSVRIDRAILQVSRQVQPDAQATIADLQGQIAVERANKESAVACVDRDVKKISALQQRVAQLEMDNRTYINERHENMKTIEALQANYDRVLGLVQALPVVPTELSDTVRARHVVAYIYVGREQIGLVDPIEALLKYRASLPAQPAQGGAASKPVTTCNRHSDCDAADEKARAKGALHADHCHDDCCSECFGN